MPTNITDDSVFTDPIQGPADADPQSAASYLLGYQGLANRTRYLYNQLAGEANCVLRLSPWIGIGVAASDIAAPTWISQVFGLSPNQGHNLVSAANFAVRHVAISDLVPDGATVIRVKALVKPGAARVGTSRMSLSLFRHLQSFDPPYGDSFVGPIAEVLDNGTTDAQAIDSGSISIPIDRNAEQLVARLAAGNDAATNRDRVLGWEIRYLGPRYRALG